MINVTCSLQTKKDYYYAVLNYKDKETGKFKTKWLSTKLKVKGNLRKAERMAEDFRRDFEKSLNANTFVTSSASHILFSNYMKEWLDTIKHNVEENTFAGYSLMINNKIIPFFESLSITLAELKPVYIQSFYNSLYDTGSKASNVLHYHTLIKQALKYAVNMELIAANPADKVKRPKKEQFIGAFYSKEEVEKLFEVSKNDPLEVPILVSAYYGLRKSELLGLTWDAIDFNNKVITIKRTVLEVYLNGKREIITKERTKNKSSYRTLPLVPVIENTLLKLKSEQEENKKLYKSNYSNKWDNFVFVTPLGEILKPGYLTQHFNILQEKHNLRHIRWHDLRHTSASLLLANGGSIKEIQEWLGHSSYSTTANIYAHLESDRKINCANIMNTVLSNKKSTSISDTDKCTR